MKDSIFREYDIRGKYPDTINENTAYIIGRSYGSFIKEKYNQTSCVVSHDNRLSSDALSDNLIKGLMESGCNVIDYGLTTTPMNYYARYLNHLFGIMVTASHNPKDDNGFKFSFDHLSNARGDMIKEFKEYTLKGNFLSGNGTLTKSDITNKYLEYMKDNISFGQKRRKVIIDCGNGVTTTIAKKIHQMFNIDFEIICEENDGTFPNHHPDPVVEDNLAMLKKRVLETKADLGIAYDGDGDRLGVINEKGEFLGTEKYMIIIIRDLINKVKNNSFLYDVKCTRALEDEIRKMGGNPVLCRTGASFTQAKTKEMNIPFGGEYSGHLYFTDRANDIGSGIYAGLRLLEILSKTPEPLSKLYEGISNYYSTPEILIPSDDSKKFIVVEKIKDYLLNHNYKIDETDGVKVLFSNGWALVRASNTSPKLSIRIEAQDEISLNNLQNFITTLVNEANK